MEEYDPVITKLEPFIVCNPKDEGHSSDRLKTVVCIGY